MPRILTLAAIITFLLCYLEWGKDQSGFFFQVEYTILTQKPSLDNFMHPLIFGPLIGQILLLYTLFKKQPPRKLIIIGLVPMILITLLVLTAGILSLNWRIIGSVMPFGVSVVFLFISFRKQRQQT
jgi:hypothetical protein